MLVLDPSNNVKYYSNSAGGRDYKYTNTIGFISDSAKKMQDGYSILDTEAILTVFLLPANVTLSNISLTMITKTDGHYIDSVKIYDAISGCAHLCATTTNFPPLTIGQYHKYYTSDFGLSEYTSDTDVLLKITITGDLNTDVHIQSITLFFN